MAADLAALPVDGAEGGAVPIVVTTGNAEANRKLVEQHGIRGTVLLQEQMEVASQYRAQGTPMGYRLDTEGRIASELAVGAEPLLLLAMPLSQRLAATEGSANEHTRRPSGNGAAHKKPRHADPSLARSRLNRNGLKAGAKAPEFTLPRIDGGELALSDLRGERVLLVFSDPDCGPCDELAPRLQQLHLTRPELHVLVISRRDADATRAKAESLSLTYSIVLQKQWEISLKYGMFATPIGYLIDEQGLLLRDVAVGVEPILTLVEEPAPELTGVEPSLNGKEIARAT
jgi:peroxiredoxin